MLGKSFSNASAKRQKLAGPHIIVGLNASPIRRIPNEILEEILLQLVESYELPVDRFKAVACTQRVCNHWRNITIRTPRLWTSFYLTSPLPLKHVGFRLQRSGTLALDITVELNSDPADYCDHADWVSLLSLLCPHAWRWRSMDIRSSSTNVAVILEDRFRGATLSCLESLAIASPLGFQGPRSLEYACAPRLQSARLYGYHLDWTRCSLTELTSLVACEFVDSTMDVDGFANVLKSCARIEHLDLQGVTLSWLGMTEAKYGSLKANTITCVRLDKLVMKGFSPWEIFLLLGMVDSPNLRYLSLETFPTIHTLPFSTCWCIGVDPIGLFPHLEKLELGEMTEPTLAILHHISPPRHLHLDCSETTIAAALTKFIQRNPTTNFAAGILELTAHGVREGDLDLLLDGGEYFPNLVEVTERSRFELEKPHTSSAPWEEIPDQLLS